MKKVFSVLIVILLIVGTIATFAACKPAQVDPTDDNYRVFYQIFVGSFSDSDGDGVGDLRGIINRMDYLNDGNINSGKSLGVQGIWLSPIFTSPSYHKYDSANYYEIDSKFGTKEDLQELLEICHQRNVKVILDLVLNHSSKENEWFKNFLRAHQTNDVDNPYYDYYTYTKREDQVSGRSYAIMTGCGDCYYECNFDTAMPEFNYDNEVVRQQMVDVAKYWLDLGVDGFRFDAIKYIYYGDTYNSSAFWNWYVPKLQKIKPDIYTIGECWSSDSEILQYYSALNCFAFSTSMTDGRIARAARNGELNAFTDYVEKTQTNLLAKNANAMFCPFIANHDMDRAAGYLTVSSGSAYMAANLYLLCSGSPFIYYGEEIGMKGSRGSANTDANRRLAMLWGDKDSVSDPEGTTFNESSQVNGTVKQQLRDKDSLLNHYAKVIALRVKYKEIARGTYVALSTGNGKVGGFIITYNGEKTCLLHNVSSEAVVIDLPEGFATLCDFVGLGSAKLANGKLTIGAQTSVILK